MEEGARILIVDDEADFAESIGFWLTSKGYRVTKALRGVEALDLIRNDPPPDVVFLDINMPEMDGVETLRRIRQINKTIPVVVVTAAYQDEQRFTDIRSLGISGFFPKQSSFGELGRVLEVVLRTHRLIHPPSASGE